MKAQMWNKSFWIEETNPQILKLNYELLLVNSGFGICGFTENHFKPFGFTALYLLSESHLAIHTFPEADKTYIELSSCVKKPFDLFIKIHAI